MISPQNFSPLIFCLNHGNCKSAMLRFVGAQKERCAGLHIALYSVHSISDAVSDKDDESSVQSISNDFCIDSVFTATTFKSCLFINKKK
jgi:hypothetical protein